MSRILILVEGQTEERFVKDLLVPHLRTLDPSASVTPTVIPTKRVLSGRDFKGGILNYAQIPDALHRMLGDRSALVTTLIDFYGLPSGTPGVESLPAWANAREKVLHVEDAIWSDLGKPSNLAVHLALHEFEAFLFAESAALEAAMDSRGLAAALDGIRRQFASPEDINQGRETAPSKRILALRPEFGKTSHGVNAVKRIGLAKLRSECPHFAAWLDRLEAFVRG
ncbi:MAG TPA: DUF4276 family protein [Fibrobacteria bacterium]|nr:DUF4276 family protein [Fibrobacteria bacterium]